VVLNNFLVSWFKRENLLNFLVVMPGIKGHCVVQLNSVQKGLNVLHNGQFFVVFWKLVSFMSRIVRKLFCFRIQ